MESINTNIFAMISYIYVLRINICNSNLVLTMVFQKKLAKVCVRWDKLRLGAEGRSPNFGWNQLYPGSPATGKGLSSCPLRWSPWVPGTPRQWEMWRSWQVPKPGTQERKSLLKLPGSSKNCWWPSCEATPHYSTTGCLSMVVMTPNLWIFLYYCQVYLPPACYSCQKQCVCQNKWSLYFLGLLPLRSELEFKATHWILLHERGVLNSCGWRKVKVLKFNC